uniref:DUF6630 family protein n=1 Tax=Pseudomonas laurentiana TaxID=2364649 RepID=UPI0029C99124|nr:hypothetical protein [Pseudomonas laurentiana]
MISEYFNASQVQAAEQLIIAISPSDECVDRHLQMLRETELDDDEAEEAEGEPSQLLWIIKDIIDWETGFYVDWNDTESFVECIGELAESRGVTLSFGVEDPLAEEFLDEVDVPELMLRAHAELAAQGLVLWTWDTQGDAYGGWISRPEAAPVMATVAEVLGLEIREGNESF